MKIAKMLSLNVLPTNPLGPLSPGSPLSPECPAFPLVPNNQCYKDYQGVHNNYTIMYS